MGWIQKADNPHLPMVTLPSFLGFVGSFPLEEQKLCLPNQLVHDPNSWTVPDLLSLKMDYDVLVNKYGSKV